LRRKNERQTSQGHHNRALEEPACTENAPSTKQGGRADAEKGRQTSSERNQAEHDVKTVPLTNCNGHVKVRNKDYPLVSVYAWRLCKNGRVMARLYDLQNLCVHMELLIRYPLLSKCSNGKN
jgi:hypothetical protein